MFALFHRWLAVKLGLMVTVAVAAGFTLAAAMGSRAMMQSSARQHRESATNLSTSVTSTVRMTMLAGDGGHVRRVVADVTQRLPKVGIRIYSQAGDEVFAEKPPPPPPEQVPAHVRATIASAGGGVMGSAVVLPIAGGASWVACHRDGGVLGVLTVGAASRRTAGATTPSPDPGDIARLDALAAVIRIGFYQVMVAPSSPRVAEYFLAMSKRVPGVRGIAVYTPDHALAYGDKGVTAGSADVRVSTMRAEGRCLGCHEDQASVEGSTLVVAFDRRRALRDDALPALIAASLDQVMEAGLGRLAIGFLDEVAHLGAVRTLTLHDADGRLVHDAFAHSRPPAEVDSVLRTGTKRAV